MTAMDRNEFFRPLAELADQGQWDDAYVWFREHQEQFSRRERRLVREALAARLSVSRLWRAPALLAAVTLLFQMAAGGIFENQLQDLFSFLGRSFRPYMYIASVAPLLVNLALDALLAVQCYERLVLTYRLFGRRPPWARAWGAWALALALALWPACSLVPYARDLPLVLEGKWSTGIVTLEMEEDTAWNNAMAQLGRETREGYDPIPWYSNPRWSRLLMPIMPGIYNRWVLNIHIDGVDCRMGQLQFDLTDYEMYAYPVRIDYLPNSRLVLWISCGEERLR